MAKKKYDINFGIYDIDEGDWITEDENFTVEISDNENINANDFFSFFQKMISIISDHEANLIENQKEEEEEEEEEEEKPEEI